MDNFDKAIDRAAASVVNNPVVTPITNRTAPVQSNRYDGAIDKAYNNLISNGSYSRMLAQGTNYGRSVLGLDPKIIQMVQSSFKADYTQGKNYDLSIAEDYDRYTKGQMPQKYLNNYDLSDPYDQWAIENDMPAAKYALQYIDDATEQYNIGVAKQRTKDEFKADVMRHLSQSNPNMTRVAITEEEVRAATAAVLNEDAYGANKYRDIAIKAAPVEKTLEDFNDDETAYNNYLTKQKRSETDDEDEDDDITDISMINEILEQSKSVFGSIARATNLMKQSARDTTEMMKSGKTVSTAPDAEAQSDYAQKIGQSMYGAGIAATRVQEQAYKDMVAGKWRTAADDEESDAVKKGRAIINDMVASAYASSISDTGKTNTSSNPRSRTSVPVISTNPRAKNSEYRKNANAIATYSADDVVAELTKAGLTEDEIKATLKYDGRYSWNDTTPQREKAKEETQYRKGRESELDSALDAYRDEAKAAGESVGAPIRGMIPFASNERPEVLDRYREAMAAQGYTQLEIDNAIRRADLEQYLDPKQSAYNYAYELYTSMGLSSGIANGLLSKYTSEDWKNINTRMLYSTDIQASSHDAWNNALIAAAPRAALGIASGVLNLADMTTFGALPAISGQDPNEQWIAAQKLMEISANVNEFAQDVNNPTAGAAGDIAAEIIKMYALSAMGGAIGAAAGGSSAATTGLQSFLVSAAESAPFVANAMGSYYGEAMMEGASREAATIYGIVAGTFEGVTEKLAMSEALNHVFTDRIAASLARSTSKTAVHTLFSTYGMAGVNVLVSAVGEGLEEGSSYILSGLLRKMLWDNEYTMSGAGLGQDMLMGAICGGLIAGFNAPSTAWSYKAAAAIMEQTGDFGTNLDTLFSALAVEQMSEVTRQSYVNNGAEVLSAETYAQTEAEYTSASVGLKEEDARYEKRVKQIQAAVDKQQTKVQRLRDRVTSINADEDPTAFAEACNSLSGALEMLTQMQASSEQQKEAAMKEHMSNRSRLKGRIDDSQQKLNAHHVASYYATQQAQAEQTEQAKQTEVQTVDAQNEALADDGTASIEVDVETDVPGTTEADAETMTETDVDTAAETDSEVTPADVADDGETTTFQDMGADVLKEREIAKSKMYTNTYNKMYTEAENETIKAGDDKEGMYTVNKRTKSMQDAKVLVDSAINAYGSVDPLAEQLGGRNYDWTAAEYDVAMGILSVYNEEARNTGDWAKVKEWRAEIQSRVTESAQLVRAVQDYSTTPEGATFHVSKVVEALNKEKRYARLIAKGKMQPVTVSEELYSALTEATTDEAHEQVIDDIAQHIADQLPASILDKINAWRYTAMLGNVRTNVRNIGGNVTMLALRAYKNVVATGLQQIFLKQDQRTTSLFTRKVDREYAAKQWDTVSSELNGTKYQDTKRGMMSRIEQKRTIFNIKPVEWYRKITGKVLDAEDKIFAKISYVSVYAQAMKARGLTAETITEAQAKEISELAKEEALRATFRDESKLADKISEMENTNLATKLLIGGLVPYKKTPINVVKRGADYSPLGIVNGVKKAIFDVRSGECTASEAIDRISSGIAGTSLMAVGVFLAKAGILRASGDDDKKYNKFKGDLGYQPYSLQLGDFSMTIDWLTPASIPLFMGAELWNASVASASDVNADGEEVTNGEVYDNVLDTLAAMNDPLIQLSMLQGINNAFAKLGVYGNSDTDVAGALGELALGAGESFASQFVPTVFGQVARTIDSTRRTTTGDPNATFGKRADTFANKIISKIPGASTTLQPYVNVKGELEVNENHWAVRLLENTLLPGYIDNVDMTDVDVELTRLFMLTQNSDIMPTAATDRTLTRTKNGSTYSYTMNADEFTEFKQDYGRAVYGSIGDVMKTDRYKRGNDEKKAELIKNAISDASSEITEEYRKKYINTKGK